MATPAYDTSNKTEATGTATITSATLTAAAGSDRFMMAFFMSAAGAPAAHNSVAWGGASLTKRNSTLAFGPYGLLSCWYIKEADFPGGATGTVVGTLASSNDEVALFAIIFSGVDQADPFRNASMTTNTGTNSNAATITITSNADDLAVDATFGVDATTQSTGINVGTGTSRQEIDNLAGLGFQSAGLSTVAGGATVTPTWTYTGNGAGIPDWGVVGDSLKGASGGPVTTRGTPFGHRGTVFNGGRSFHGIIQ